MVRDIRRAIRTLRSWRFGALAAIATLAVGIGTTTSLYAFVRTALASTMGSVEDVARLGRLYSASRSLGIERSFLTVADLDTLAHASSFESVGAYAGDDTNLTIGSEDIDAGVMQVSAGFFPAMGARAASGRLLTPDEFATGAQSVVVSDQLWRKYFAGRTPGSAALTVGGTPRTIVGVLPAGFGFGFIGIGGDVWEPLKPGPEAARLQVNILARLRPQHTWTAARAELEGLGRPQNPNGLWNWTAISVQEDVSTRMRGGYLFMFGPAFVVLLMGCVNVSCMLFARGVDRDVELSVRSALGATRMRIMSQLFIENVVLAGLGGLLGCALALGLLRSIASTLAQYQPVFAARLAADTTLLPAAVAFSAAAAIIFGTLPAIRLSRRDVTASLKGNTRPATARFVGYGARDLVVFIELGVAVVLIVLIGMWLRLFSEMQQVAPLFPADQLVGVRVAGADADAAAARVAAVPGVTGVTIADGAPGATSPSAGAQASVGDRTIRVVVVGVDAAYFQMLGLPFLRGRPFDTAEARGRAPVAILSEGAASAMFGATGAVGADVTLTRRGGAARSTVVGVCGNAMRLGRLQSSGLRETAPVVYVPLSRQPNTDLLLVARSAADAHALVKPIAAAARSSAAARMPRATVLADMAGSRIPPEGTFFVRLFVGFGLIALLLAATGIFGVISQSVAQRMTELGVRMAMGASRVQVLRMVLVREGKLIATAIGAGAIGTVAVTQHVMGELVAIAGTDPRLWVGVSLLCASFAGTAALMATYRILKMDPWTVLRNG